MPANLGYITALLFNQNNCAAEASTVTTKYEVEVGFDLCKMVGFDPDIAAGHIVTGGTLANIESMWAARNIKYYALGLQDAINNEEALDKAMELTVYLPHKKQDVKIVDATSWELLNLKSDVIIELPEKVERKNISYLLPF
jgi:glutamate/tyrosine decarboxylase-like PLP-dependent enzyme